MTDYLTAEEGRWLLDRVRVTQARLDVLERVLPTLVASLSLEAVKAAEDWLRTAPELLDPAATTDDPLEREKLTLANAAAVRLADTFAQVIANRLRRPG